MNGEPAMPAEPSRAGQQPGGNWQEQAQGWNALSYLLAGALLGAVLGVVAANVTGFTLILPVVVLSCLALSGYVIWVRYARGSSGAASPVELEEAQWG
ncbi:MAG: hypothetical protein CSA58_03160 [Micrococcales bacterium]|nr:MAG: hypothetical protein CSB46_00810 [Micrococcales bacterium]PIE27663.1 MAG: hypothetical protein CSA58_03160 [Micrococcales bacterium]